MSFPKELNYSNNKTKSQISKPYINRYRSKNSSYLNNDVIRIEIKCGKNGEYIFPKNGFLEGSVAVSVTNSSVTTTGWCYIDQSVYSIFKRMTIKHNNTILEDQIYCNKVWTSLLDVNYSDSKRRALGLTHLIGENQVGVAVSNTTAFGAKMITSAMNPSSTTDNTSTGNNYFLDFAIPLPSSILGNLSTKAIPLGEIKGSIILELELESPNMAFVCETTTMFIPSINKYEVKNIYFNVPSVILPDEINRVLVQSMGNQFILHGISYKSCVDNIGIYSNTFNNKYNFDLASIKAFYFFMQNKTAAQGDILLRSVSCRSKCFLSYYYIVIDNESIPTQAITCSSYSSSRMFAELMSTFNKNDIGDSFINNGNYNYNSFGSTVHYQLNPTTSGDFGAASPQARFIAGLLLDKFPNSSENLICGKDTLGKSIDLFLNFSQATAAAIMLYCFVSYDVIYTISNGEIKVTK